MRCCDLAKDMVNILYRCTVRPALRLLASPSGTAIILCTDLQYYLIHNLVHAYVIIHALNGANMSSASILFICSYLHRPIQLFKELGIPGPKPKPVLGNLGLFHAFDVSWFSLSIIIYYIPSPSICVSMCSCPIHTVHSFMRACLCVSVCVCMPLCVCIACIPQVYCFHWLQTDVGEL